MKPRVNIEVCVDSVAGALAAEQGGANRIELCSALGEGGLTPSAGLTERVRGRVRLTLAVMIRPRAGDFLYSDDEFEVMRRDLVLAKQLGADMIVLGLLTTGGDVDVPRTRELVALARPLPITFHRAFDMARDPHAALDDLISLGIERVLTSGLERSVLEGLDLIAELVRRAAGRILVVPGGGVTERNVAKILAATGAAEFHVSASVPLASGMTFRNGRVAMGRQYGPSEYAGTVADAGRVAAFRALAGDP
ncbi:MAG: copper homeostasis protein CutC [Limisphaerales bacterium]